ncbi:hypothetical protein Bbelb_269410 [Branchiostoma belcheri]|nr:hypothetical protein Bbelb_269410 [Branchiostoma belcheri]
MGLGPDLQVQAVAVDLEKCWKSQMWFQRIKGSANIGPSPPPCNVVFFIRVKKSTWDVRVGVRLRASSTPGSTELLQTHHQPRSALFHPTARSWKQTGDDRRVCLPWDTSKRSCYLSVKLAASSRRSKHISPLPWQNTEALECLRHDDSLSPPEHGKHRRTKTPPRERCLRRTPYLSHETAMKLPHRHAGDTAQ